MTKEELKTHRHNLHALFLRSKSRSDQITCHEVGKLLDLLIEGCEIVDVENLLKDNRREVFSQYGVSYEVVTVADLKENIKKTFEGVNNGNFNT